MAERLDKLVADHGARSRKQARALIRAGRVTVDGARVLAPDGKVSYHSVVLVDGAAVCAGYSYRMLNKPAGVLCATRDRSERTVLDLLDAADRRRGLFPAGRLDKDAEGLVLLTDDGVLAHRLLAPSNRCPKVYRVRLDRAPDWRDCERLFRDGVPLGDGRVSSPAQLEVLEGGAQPLAGLTIFEGAYHQVKIMFERAGCRVRHLERVAIGPLRLDASLERGQSRPLTAAEIDSLRDAASSELTL